MRCDALLGSVPPRSRDTVRIAAKANRPFDARRRVLPPHIGTDRLHGNYGAGDDSAELEEGALHEPREPFRPPRLEVLGRLLSEFLHTRVVELADLRERRDKQRHRATHR